MCVCVCTHKHKCCRGSTDKLQTLNWNFPKLSEPLASAKFHGKSHMRKLTRDILTLSSPELEELKHTNIIQSKVSQRLWTLGMYYKFRFEFAANTLSGSYFILTCLFTLVVSGSSWGLFTNRSLGTEILELGTEWTSSYGSGSQDLIHKRMSLKRLKL